jgi:hypothetical protein
MTFATERTTCPTPSSTKVLLGFVNLYEFKAHSQPRQERDDLDSWLVGLLAEVRPVIFVVLGNLTH